MPGRHIGPTNPFVPFTQAEVEQSIPARFEQQVATYPDRMAVKGGTHALTYDELNKAANHVAHAILAQRGHNEEPIALLFKEGALVIAAILGVLKAGKMYVPLDATYPRTRTVSSLEDSGAGLLITHNQNLALARELAQGRVGLLNIDALDSSVSTENPHLPLSPQRLAYIMYTSGSTGQPKGVVETHRNVLHQIMRLTNAFHICMADRQTLLRSCSFNGSVRDIFSTLLNGASLHVLNLAEEGIGKLAAWLIQEEITIFRAVSSVYRHFVSTLTGEQRFPSLRLIYAGGEAVNRRDVELFQQHFPEGCMFVNGLATTETGTIRLFCIDTETRLTGGFAPVGYAVEDMEVLLRDDEGLGVGCNEIGEIAVKSRYLSPGYWRRPDLTQAKFLPDPNGGAERLYLTGDLGRMLPDGCLEHLGRKDFQVKVRGHRIEVGEIETALLALDTIKEAVVVAREDRPDDKRLVAYLVPTHKPAPIVNSLRRALSETLPDRMIPSAFVLLDALPLTPTGKVDRRALPAPGRTRPALDNPFVAPCTPVEKALADVWAEVLGVDQVSVLDNFLELGGDSLLAAKVVAWVRETFHVDVPPWALLEAPTMVDMVAVIVQSQAAQAAGDDVQRLLAEVEALTDEQARQLSIDELHTRNRGGPHGG